MNNHTRNSRVKIRLLMVILAFLGWGLLTISNAQAIEVGKYKTYELNFTANNSTSDPFNTYLLRLKITDPDGTPFDIDGFYDGDGNGGQDGKVWKARICPYKTGNWSWKTIPGDNQTNQTMDINFQNKSGSFICVESGDLGGVINDGQHFRFQDGDYVYLIANFLDFVDDRPSTHLFMSEGLATSSKEGIRNGIIARQRDYHQANKINVYLANRNDYDDWWNYPTTPWTGDKDSNNKEKMDLARWKNYDGYIQQFKDNGMIASLWFFADDSGFGGLDQTVKNRLFRYAMARLSAFSNTMFVIALEWGEGWTSNTVTVAGNYIQKHNPWGRLLSAHHGETWDFPNEDWPTFIATQYWGGDIKDVYTQQPEPINSLASNMRSSYGKPHINEEFGLLCNGNPTVFLEGKSFCDSRHKDKLRPKLWANFLGGAAGSGTGDGLKGLQTFLSVSRIPFQRMAPNNNIVDGGGDTRFCLADEEGHHYVVYSRNKNAFNLTTSGNNLKGIWFDPENRLWTSRKVEGQWFVASDTKQILDNASDISSGTITMSFNPPSGGNSHNDSVLWITDGTNLNSGVVHPSTEATITVVTDGGEYTNSTEILTASWTPFDNTKINKINGYEYRILQDSTTGANITDWISTNNTTETATNLSLQDGKKYYFGVRAKNTIGLWSHVVYSDGITIRIDTVPPAISNVVAAKITTNSTDITWQTNEPATSQVDYGKNTSYGTTVSDTNLTNHSVNLSGLSANTKYFFRITSKDSSGNSASYAEAFTTLNTPPAAPVNLTAVAVSPSQITLSWTDKSANESGLKIERSSDNITFTQIGSVGANVTTYSATGLTLNTTYYFRVRAYNNGGNSNYSNTASATTLKSPDTTPPSGTVKINNDDVYTKETTVTLTLSATDKGSSVTHMSFSNIPGLLPNWVNYATTASWRLTSGDGTNTVYVKYKDAAGNESAVCSDTIILDPAPPTSATNPVKINSDSVYANSTLVTLTLSASGMAQMQFSNDGYTYSEFESYNTTKSWTLTLGSGPKTVYAIFKDALGKTSKIYADRIILDSMSPSGSISINGNAYSTNSTLVTLTLSAQDSISGIAQMSFSNDLVTWSSPEAYATTKSWRLASGNGVKTVYVKYKDTAGNESSAYSDTITLDATSPTGSITINGGAAYTNSCSVTLTLTAQDVGSGVTKMRISNTSNNNNAQWEAYAPSKTWSITADKGLHTVYVKYKDVVGNESAECSDSITLN